MSTPSTGPDEREDVTDVAEESASDDGPRCRWCEYGADVCVAAITNEEEECAYYVIFNC